MGKDATSETIPLESRIDLRGEFLRTCFELQPALDKRLGERVYPAYRSLPVLIAVTNAELLACHAEDLSWESSERNPEYRYVQTLREWADEFHIKEDWVLRAVHSKAVFQATRLFPTPTFAMADACPAKFTQEEVLFVFAHPGWFGAEAGTKSAPSQHQGSGGEPVSAVARGAKGQP